MSTAALLVSALLLDALLGEPRVLWDRIPHPAVLMGRLISTIDHRFNEGEDRRRKGTFAFAMLCVGALFLGTIIATLPFGGILELLCVTVLLAQRSLVDHVAAVAQALRLSVQGARTAVAKIVGRDTAQMDGSMISRAAIESAAENFSDGVIAPAFWFLVLGLPGLLLYKVTNTADSMIGYRTERHEEFGWAAARFDDLLNYLPARITALLILIACGTMKTAPTVRQDAPKHRSPNAGWPEAAMATSLNIALAGPRSYDGKLQDFPFVNATGRKSIGPAEIGASVAVLWRAWALGLALCALIALL